MNGPGKFEGEPDYAPFLWDVIMEGGEDETADDPDTETQTSLVKVDAELSAKFPELAGVWGVALWESDLGFVFTQEVTAEEWEAFGDAETDGADPDEPEDKDADNG